MPSRPDWIGYVEHVRASIGQSQVEGAVNVQGSTALRTTEEFGEAPRIWMVVGDTEGGTHTFEITSNLLALLTHQDQAKTPQQLAQMKRDFPDMKVNLPENIPSPFIMDSVFFGSREDSTSPFAIIALETGQAQIPPTPHRVAPKMLVALDEGIGLRRPARDLPVRLVDGNMRWPKK